MNKPRLILLLAAVTLTSVSYASPKETPKKETPKVLVLYYSQTGNTKAVAEEIAKRLSADIEEITPVEPYEPNFQETIERCMKERELGIIPRIDPVKADLVHYDVIFIGFPVWFGTYAPPVTAFLNDVDLSGKIIVPFCTFGSGGLESSVKDMVAAEPNAKILPGYGVRAARLEAMPEEVDIFLKSSGFLEGEYPKLEKFPDQHAVSADEAAIFNAAVDGYPMLHAKAKTVASRAIPNGTEYLFTAVDLPREDKPDMPPAGKIQVYVIAVNDADPVFTKVIR